MCTKNKKIPESNISDAGEEFPVLKKIFGLKKVKKGQTLDLFYRDTKCRLKKFLKKRSV